MKHLLLALLLTSTALTAADVTGKWSGRWEMPQAAGEQPHYMVLKQEGGVVTGTAGPDASQQFDIRNGKMDGDKLTFEVSPGGGPLMKFEFKVDGDNAVGQAQIEAEGRSMVVKLSVQRKK